MNEQLDRMKTELRNILTQDYSETCRYINERGYACMAERLKFVMHLDEVIEDVVASGLVEEIRQKKVDSVVKRVAHEISRRCVARAATSEAVDEDIVIAIRREYLTHSPIQVSKRGGKE